MPDIAHTFRAGHRIMVQVQSSWFPLTDRNPQKFIEIPKALSTDFDEGDAAVYFGGADGSKIHSEWKSSCCCGPHDMVPVLRFCCASTGV